MAHLCLSSCKLTYMPSNASIYLILCTSADHKYTEFCCFYHFFFFVGGGLVADAVLKGIICFSSVLNSLAVSRLAGVRLLFFCPSKKIFTHSCCCVSVSSHLPSVVPFSTRESVYHAALASPEANDQKYQKISANEESPAATCCMKPTLAALLANFVLKMLNEGQLKHTA